MSTYQYRFGIIPGLKRTERGMEVRDKSLQINTPSNPAVAYRAEIDGLRAIAVLSVLIYHAFPQLLPSGFIGVDIFFVISGYLITSILIKEIEANEFSFLKFYERRARRLLPPLLPVLAVTTIMCAALLSESKFREFLDSIKATSLFVSNWHFYSTISYFDTPGLVTPLLHTWSLAIEEQFYFIFPAILFTSYKLYKKPASPVIGTLLLASLCYSIYLLSTNQNEAAFYNSAARFWELSIGSFIAALPALRSSKLVHTALEASGATLIAWALATFDHDTVFPGPSALFPTVGTALILMACGNGHLAALLRLRPLVAVGLISYALYLWHWPLMAAARSVNPAPPIYIMLTVIAVTFVLAWLSYTYVENPIRSKKILTSKPEAWGLVAFSVIGIFLIGFYLKSNTAIEIQNSTHAAVMRSIYPESNLLSTIESEKKVYLSDLNRNFHGQLGPYDAIRDSGKTCSFDQGNTKEQLVDCLIAEAKVENVLIMGDSIGRDTLHALRAAFPDRNFIMLHQSGCPPGETSSCFNGQREILYSIKENIKISDIIINFRYRPGNYERVRPGLIIAKEITPNVYMFGISPEFKMKIDDYIKTSSFRDSTDAYISEANSEMVSWSYTELLKKAEAVAMQEKVRFVNVLPFFCETNGCKIWVDNRYGDFLFWDEQHLTKKGIVSFSSYLKKHPQLSSLN